MQTLLWQSEDETHDAPEVHLPQLPPQSIQDSEPFFTPSTQEPTTHTPFVQTLLWQSTDEAQVPPVPHGAHNAPPQSRPVSTPFLTPSPQAGARQDPALHTPLWQSVAAPHVSPVGHLAQPPPQSAEDSLPFRMPSEQVAARQTPPLQLWLMQSESSTQIWAVSQGKHGPPQSASVSVPFSTPSSHAAAAQSCPLQTPLAQSDGAAHWSVSPHGPHSAPPQSESVSEPFCTESPHELGTHWPRGSQTYESQSTPVMHWTHLPVLQMEPSLSEHAIPERLVVTFAPLRQLWVVQTVPSSGMSVSSARTFVAPVSSQTVALQSPGFSSPILVPAGTSCVPHRPFQHVRTRHGLPGSGQSEVELHSGPDEVLPLPAPPAEDVVAVALATVVPAPPEPEPSLLQPASRLAPNPKTKQSTAREVPIFLTLSKAVGARKGRGDTSSARTPLP